MTVSVYTRHGPALFLRSSSRADSSRCRRAPGTSRSQPLSSIPLIRQKYCKSAFSKDYLSLPQCCQPGIFNAFFRKLAFFTHGAFSFVKKTHYKITKCPIFVVRAFFKWPYVVKSLFRPFFPPKMGHFVRSEWLATLLCRAYCCIVCTGSFCRWSA